MSVMIPLNIANFQNFLPYVPLYAARSLNFFKKKQLAIEFLQCGDDRNAIQTLLDKRAHFAVTDPTYCFTEKGKLEKDIVVIAPFLNRAALWAVSRSPIDQLSVANPLAITYAEQSTACLLARNWSAKYSGVSPMCISPRPAETFKQYLKNLLSSNFGVVPDVLFVTEPEATWLSAPLPGKSKKLGQGEYPYIDQLTSEPFVFTTIMTRREFLSKHREIVNRFLGALEEAFGFIHSLPRLLVPKPGDSDEWATFLRSRWFDKQYFGWNELAKSTARFVATTYPADIKLPPKIIASIISNLREKHFFPTSIKIDSKFRAQFKSTYMKRFPFGDKNLIDAFFIDR